MAFVRPETTRPGILAGIAALMIVLGAACTPTAPGADVTAPVIDSIAIAPGTVDTAIGAQTMTLTVELSEPESAVQSATVNFLSPSGGQTLSISVTPADLIAGDTSSGTYEATAQLPQFAEQGTWSAAAAYTVNTSGAFSLLDAGTIAASGLATSFEQTGAGDATAPTALSIVVDPVVIDTSTSGQLITVTALIDDDLSGHVSTSVRFNSPSQAEFVVATFDAGNRVAGDALSGTYEDTVLVPAGSETGSWWALALSTTDEVGNFDVLDAGDLSAAGLTVNFDQVG